MRPHDETIHIGDFSLSLHEAAETLAAIREGRVDAVVVEGDEGAEVFTFRDPSHPFRLLIESMNEGAILTTSDGLICYQNPCFSKLVGLEPSWTQGRPLSDLVPQEHRDTLARMLERAQSGASVRGHLELVGALGEAVNVQFSVSRARLADVDVFCVVVTDLTEQRRQEGLYRTARQEIEARDRLFAIAAHELRNPLGVLELQASTLEVLFETGRDGTPISIAHGMELVSKLRLQGRRLAQLVTNLLDIGTLGPGRMHLSREEFDLSDAVRAAIDLSRDEILRSGSALELDLCPVFGCWDRVRIEQIIENLVSNAAKYGLGRPIKVFVYLGNGVACLGVEDHGRGIPEEARERIFRPFERVTPGSNVPGLGIGLYVTAEIVKAHRGRIRVDDTPGGGSRFVVELPLDSGK